MGIKTEKEIRERIAMLIDTMEAARSSFGTHTNNYVSAQLLLECQKRIDELEWVLGEYEGKIINFGEYT